MKKREHNYQLQLTIYSQWKADNHQLKSQIKYLQTNWANNYLIIFE